MANEIDSTKLNGLIEAVSSDKEKAQTVWKASTRWTGGFSSTSTIRDFEVPMDEPEGLGGSNTAPNMVEAVLAAYGSCLTVGYALNANQMGIELDDIRVDLEGGIDLRGFLGVEDPKSVWPGYRGISVKVNLDSKTATEAQLKELHEKVQKTSPVGSIIARPVEIATTIAINEN